MTVDTKKYLAFVTGVTSLPSTDVAALIARAQANSEATNCQYVAGSQPSSDEHLHVAGYIY